MRPLITQNLSSPAPYIVVSKCRITIIAFTTLTFLVIGLMIRKHSLPAGITCISAGALSLALLGIALYRYNQHAKIIAPQTEPKPVAPPSLPSLSRKIMATEQDGSRTIDDSYEDPFIRVATEEQFLLLLSTTLSELEEPSEKDHGEKIETTLALLCFTVTLHSYAPSESHKQQITLLLQNHQLSLGILFSLQQLLQQAPEKSTFQITQAMQYASGQDMRPFCFTGLSPEKELSIVASDLLEGSDMCQHGLRIAIHQKPHPARIKALIVAHRQEFISGKRDFIFEANDEEDRISDLLSQFVKTNAQARISQALYDLSRDSTKSYSIANRCQAIETVIDSSRIQNDEKATAKKNLEEFYKKYYPKTQEKRRKVMLYLINALEEGRRHYYGRHPHYFDKERLAVVIKEYEAGNGKAPWGKPTMEEAQAIMRRWDDVYAIVIREGEERYLFEAAAQHLENLKERITSALKEEEFEELAEEFYAHYKIVYEKLPTFSLSVAALIHPHVISRKSQKMAKFIQKGTVPPVLTKLQKISYRELSQLSEHFQELTTLLQNPDCHSLICQLEKALDQTECYTEVDNNPLSRPEGKIYPLYQPQLIFEAIEHFRLFLQKEEAKTNPEALDAIRKQYPLLDRLEQDAASLILEAVRNDFSLKTQGLSLVAEQARKKRLLRSNQSIEQELEQYATYTLRGYQNLRFYLYNSKIVKDGMREKGVEELFQKLISPLNSGLLGILSQLLSFHDKPLAEHHIVGESLKRGSFYGHLEIQPDRITPGTIVVLSTLPHNIVELHKASAIIVEEGGPLSHAAHIARELTIPVITGARGALAHLQTLQGKAVSLTLSPTGNKIELTSLPFPQKEESLPLQKKPVQKINEGGKGIRLLQLQSLLSSLPKIKGIQLTFPPFMILGIENEIKAFYATSYEGSTLKEAIMKLLDSPDQIWELIKATPLPFSLETYKNILSSDQPLIARSSAAVEDGYHSFAGMFASIPQLSSIEELELGIKKVLFSAFSSQVTSYAEQVTIDYSPFDMAVILQHYVADADFSGVALSKNPVDGSEKIEIQFVQGVGGGVDGEGHPNLITIEKGAIVRALLRDQRGSLTPSQLRKMGLLIEQLEIAFGFPVDVEFAIKKSDGEELTVSLVQIRQITAMQ